MLCGRLFNEQEDARGGAGGGAAELAAGPGQGAAPQSRHWYGVGVAAPLSKHPDGDPDLDGTPLTWPSASPHHLSLWGL